MPQDDTRTRILNAAGNSFSQRGFRQTTVRDICRRAEVNLAAVNYHFGDKEGLYLETVRHAHQLRSREAPLPDWPPDASAADKLRDFVKTLLVRMIGDLGQTWPARLMMREILHPTAAARHLVEDYFRPHLELLLSILDEMVPPETPFTTRQRIAFSVIGQCMFYRFNSEILHMFIPDDVREAEFNAAVLGEHVADFTLAALGVEPLFDTAPPRGGDATDVDSEHEGVVP